MKLYKKIYVGLTACSVLALSACGGSSVKETLGIGNSAPDEFRVVSRPPLSVPPQFNLRPPSSDAPSPIIVPADKQAKSIVTGSPVGTTNAYSDSGYDNTVDTSVMAVESASTGSNVPARDKTTASNTPFLKKIGVDKADPAVRDELVKQKIQAQEKKEEGSWWSSVTSTEKKDTLVNAQEEAKRIKTNQTENKPVTAGQTPEVKDKDRGLLGNIFGW